MKKKIVSVLLCATMVTGLAMGCGKSSDSSSEKTSDGKTKIRMTYWNNLNFQPEIALKASQAEKLHVIGTLNLCFSHTHIMFFRKFKSCL